MNTKAILTTVFAGSVVLANILAAKLTFATIPILGGVAIPAGFIAFGVAYLASDLLVEFHGKEVAHSVVNGTIITILISYALIFIAIALPPAPFYGGEEAYESVLGNSASILLASVIALGLAQHIDVRLFARLREYTDGRHKWLRNCGSTGLSQLLDTTVFISLGFAIFPAVGLGGTPTWGIDLLLIVIGQYLFKLLVAGLDTIPFYLLTCRE